MNLFSIDVNCDVGEGIDNELTIMPLISSCSIACGGHAGDSMTISKTIELALLNRVHIGAHPSYPDKTNFGRKEMDIPLDELQKSLEEQINTVQNELRRSVATMNHVKAHGALYNKAAVDAETAQCVIDAVKNTTKDVWLYAPFRSVLAEMALKQDLRVRFEAFIDRNYNADLTLVSRSEPKAIITDPKKVLKHLLRMITKHNVKTIDGKKIAIKAKTFCVHGDNPNALRILNYLSRKLPNFGINIA
ncbi:5-oxoprolinase subunit PxpA [Aureibaculum sp. 2210JD6-5]|uniref:5-oxoprolinase subunit PxpA n=1 Tax=Aureibaculum sp. 2210JD6-5 TaxID=3103957 RepID=UPI002AAC6FEE|nr:5-oxoprolinase subunit PxpA [Aureibaculum sp. 2210JD6-5]MDY7393832.1 5-oxoprolinase subunit PxpA [Aureibaculum sp. 2210JD6-5]